MAIPYTKVLESIVGLDENIIGAAVIAETVYAHVKSNPLKLTETQIAKLASQVDTVVSIGKTNEQFFGKMSYVHFKFQFLNVILFSLDTFKILAVGIGEPYDLEKKLVEQISKLAIEFVKK
jgi:hypothetical protein